MRALLKLNVLLVSLLLMLSGCGVGDDDGGQAADADVSSSKKFRWKMVTAWPANFPVFQEGVEKFAADVGVMSNGRLDIRVFAGGELVPSLGVFDAVSQGSVELGHGSAYYWAGKIPAAQFLSAVPFGLTAQGMNSWIDSGGGLQIWRELYQPFRVVPFPMGNTGMQMGGWFNKRVDSIEDLKGLKMRIPGLGGKVFAKAGGNPVLLAGGEVYTSLERNTIDATEWVGPYHDMRLGLERAAKYYYYPGWHEPGTVLELIVSEPAWAALPEDLKRTLEVAAAATNAWMLAQMETLNSKALIELRAKPNIEILPFPEAVLAELRRLTEVTLDGEAAKDPEFARVLAAYRAYRDESNAWNDVAEDAYRRSRP
jgi:TRAP-type mannitol/chloroaromatic compound transport system substrate-binding protein